MTARPALLLGLLAATFTGVGAGSAQVRDTLEYGSVPDGLDRHVLSPLVRLPLWPDDPYLDLPGRGSEVRLGRISLADRWGRERLTTPALIAAPLHATAGLLSGTTPAPVIAFEDAVFQPSPVSPWDGVPLPGGIVQLERATTRDWSLVADVGLQTAALVGRYLREPGRPASAAEWPDFTRRTYSVATGGTVLDGRLSVDVAAQVAEHDRQEFGFAFGRDSEQLIRIGAQSLERFREALNEAHGLDGGGFGATRLDVSSATATGKLGWRLASSLELDLSVLAASGGEELEVRSDTFALRNGFYAFRSQLAATSMEGRWRPADDVIGTIYLTGRTARDYREPGMEVPEILLPLDPQRSTEFPVLAAGGRWVAQGDTAADESLTAGLNLRLGRFEAGGELERTWAQRVRRPGWRGRYVFENIEQLLAGTPLHQEVMRYGPSAGAADFETVRGAGWLAADAEVLPDVEVTAGVRADWLDHGEASPSPELVGDSLSAGATAPDGAWQLSPRLGVAWSPGRIPGLRVAGAAGAYVAPIPLAALASGYSDELAILEYCTDFPVAIALSAASPACQGTTGTGRLVGSESVVFTTGLEPQRWWSWSGEAAYERPRWRVGVAASGGSATSALAVLPLQVVPGEAGADRVVLGLGSAAGWRERRLAVFGSARLRGFELGASVMVDQREDRFSATTAEPVELYRRTAVPEAGEVLPPYATSRLEVGDRLRLSVGRQLGEALYLRLDWMTRAGIPYSWAALGDPGGDGIDGNDLPYIPEDGYAVRWINDGHRDLFNAILDRYPCLSAARGRTLERNACRGPRVGRLDVFAELTTPLSGVALWLQVLNAGNALNNDWGQIDIPPEVVPLVRVIEPHPSPEQRVYELVQGQTTLETQRPESQWRAELGIRFGSR